MRLPYQQVQLLTITWSSPLVGDNRGLQVGTKKGLVPQPRFDPIMFQDLHFRPIIFW